MEIKDILTKYGQQHLLEHVNKISEEQKDSLYTQISRTDFELMKSLYEMAQEGVPEDMGDITPASQALELSGLDDEERQRLYNIGADVIQKGAFAAMTMAGGQGTRLGHSGPKGTYDLGEGCGTLFGIQCRKLLAYSRKFGRDIPWYIMTSYENDKQTREFFRANDYFGYNKDSIFFFVQNMLPMILTDGRFVMDSPGSIKEGADGHGGIFKAAFASGAVEDMEKRGIKWIFIGGIDNVLLKICDPVFIGYMEQSGALLGSKTLAKCQPYEKVGVFCKKNGKPYVIEYTEVSDEMALMTKENGEYVYGDAHILCNMFSFEAFKKMASMGLPYHVALKKSNYVGEDGKISEPSKPNAYKFETFIFDAFNYFDDIKLVRVKREEEFAPLKNKTGVDSAETARQLYLEYIERKGNVVE